MVQLPTKSSYDHTSPFSKLLPVIRIRALEVRDVRVENQGKEEEIIIRSSSLQSCWLLSEFEPSDRRESERNIAET